jgi:23S rRNA (cytidine2498-2'-O)-methyltransferase
LIASPFVFVTCQAGAEAHLKREVARLQPDWRPAFLRPGFVTFKRASGRAELDVALGAVFARAYAVSFGKTHTVEAIADFAAKLPAAKRLHVWSRAAHLPGDEPPQLTDLAPQLEAEIRERGEFLQAHAAAIGDAVVDVVIVDPGELWIGAHVHSSLHAPWPGGRPDLTMPEAAPSRAYLKMVESLLWSGAPIVPGSTVLELGSAPGGASYALLERGINVVGVDTADMSERVLDFPGPARFRHVRKRVAQLRASDVPSEPMWVALDVNLHPNDIFPALERVVSFAADRVRGALLTFKLTDDKVAATVPQLLERVRVLGFGEVRARQLAYGRREIFAFASRK